MRKLFLLLALLAALLAASGLAWAEGSVLGTGALALVDLDRGEAVYSFVPVSGSVYDICVFPAGEAEASFHLSLYEGEQLISEATEGLTAISERLTAGTTYTLRLTGAGQVRLEAARHALSRCFEQPMALSADGDSYAKAIARSGDVHWYAVTAELSLPEVLTGLPDDPGLRLEARLFNESGRLLAEATQTAGGAFLLDFMPRSGRVYRVRVSAAAGATGLYSLTTAQGDGGLPEALALSQTELKLEGRQSRRLSALFSPTDATDAVFWESSDPAVAKVSQGGMVTGVSPGDAVITAYGAGAVRARCRVEVTRVPVEGIRLLTPRVELDAGDTGAVRWEIIPKNATRPDVEFELTPEEGIVSVDGSGRLTALEAGTASLTIRALDGGCRVTAAIQVNPPPKRCRALLIGEQNYAATVASQRQGSANSVAGLRTMLNQLDLDGEPFDVHTALDVSRDGAIHALWETFHGATRQDLSLIYITCHGYYANGMTCFQMYDGSILTALELRMALEQVPGSVVLLADCCGSGGIIGQAGTTADLLAGIDAVFSGAAGPSTFDSSRFRVLASASIEQDSYRIGFEDREGESAMATVFARAVCEGCGWSIEGGSRVELLADANADGQISLDELYRYTARRVTAYLALGQSEYVQTVRVSPGGDVRALFGRTEDEGDEG